MIGKRTIMAEELKGQVGEHIPTVIPLMAQAMGVDVKTLFKMMQDGQLDPMVALPKLAALMKDMSEPAMAKYMQSLPYRQGKAQENQELWLQQFNESGGTAGLTRFWKVWGQMIEDTIPSAEKLGSVFEVLATKFSNALLIPQEFIRWFNGETDERNIWQKMFGDSSSNQIIVSTKKLIDDLKISIGLLTESLQNMSEGFRLATDESFTMWVRAVIESMGVLAKMVGQFANGDFTGIGKTWDDWQKRSAELIRERDAAQSARASMTNQYGADEKFWPSGEYTKRYNELLSEKNIPDIQINESAKKLGASGLGVELGVKTRNWVLDFLGMNDTYQSVMEGYNGFKTSDTFGSEVSVVPQPTLPNGLNLPSNDISSFLQTPKVTNNNIEIKNELSVTGLMTDDAVEAIRRTQEESSKKAISDALQIVAPNVSNIPR